MTTATERMERREKKWCKQRWEEGPAVLMVVPLALVSICKNLFRLDRWKALLFLAAVLVYLPVINGGFISDDVQCIQGNPALLQPLTQWQSPKMFCNSLALLMFGSQAFWAFHLYNILLHGVNTVLVFCFLRIFYPTWPAWIGSLVFAVHPIHTEAICWISGGGYATMLFFALTIYLLYHYSTLGRFRAKMYWLAVGMYAYAVSGHYSWLCMMPFWMALVDISQRTIGRWRQILPFVLIAAVTAIVLLPQINMRIQSVEETNSHPAQTDENIDVLGIISPELPGIVYAVKNYGMRFIFSTYNAVSLVIWPWPLTFYHDPLILTHDQFCFWILCAVLMFIALPLILIAPSLLLALSFYVFLVPMVSPMVVAWPVAERYLYIPSVALSVLIAQFWGKGNNMKSVVLVLIIVFSALTAIRDREWAEPLMFWIKTAEKSAESAKAHGALALAYLQDKNTEYAIKEFETAVKLDGQNWQYRYNLGAIYMMTKRYPEALRQLTQAKKLRPDEPKIQEMINKVMHKAKTQ